MKNNDSASAWLTPIFRNSGWLEAMATTSVRGRPGRPPYGVRRHQVITSLPEPVCTAIDEVAAKGGVSRMVAISDLAALAMRRRDLALRLSLPDEMAPENVIAVAGRRLVDCRGWSRVTTQIPADLLPELDALVTATGVTRSRIVANLVTHMVSQERPELATIDIAWPNQQGRLPLAI